MKLHPLVRAVAMVVVVASAELIPLAVSAAQTTGSELAEDVAAGTSGADAFIVLNDVATFPADGGEAVFEPGTHYEETFVYASVDAEANHLVGLTRDAPAQHPAGALVAPVTEEPSGEPTPEPTGPLGGAAAGTTETQTPAATTTLDAEGEPSSVADRVADPPSLPSPATTSVGAACVLGTADPCDETPAEAVSDPIPCEDPTAVVCGIVNEVTSCDAGTVVCAVFHEIEELLEGIDGRNPCDPHATGQTCDVWLNGLANEHCVGEVCQLWNEPLGPWSVCDVDDTEQECPDADDLVDLVWDLDNPLSDLECEAQTTGPTISSNGQTVRGTGAFGCNGEAVAWIDLKVCLHRASGGAWLKMGCRTAWHGFVTSVSKKIAEPCVKQQTVKYRVRARGYAQDGPDWDKDSDKSTATLYCPGASVEGLSQEVVDYGETWLPTET